MKTGVNFLSPVYSWEIQGYQGFDSFLTVPYFKAGLQWYQTQSESHHHNRGALWSSENN